MARGSVSDFVFLYFGISTSLCPQTSRYEGRGDPRDLVCFLFCSFPVYARTRWQCPKPFDGRFFWGHSHFTGESRFSRDLCCGFLFFLYLSFFRRFLFISFDRDEYKIQVGNPLPFDLLFYIILAASLTVAVNLLGTFYSIAHLLLPVFALLPVIRSLKILTIVCVLFSIFSTCIGFMVSLVGLDRNGEMIYFPTSSSIILVLCFFAFLIHLIRFLISSVFSKRSR